MNDFIKKSYLAGYEEYYKIIFSWPTTDRDSENELIEEDND